MIPQYYVVRLLVHLNSARLELNQNYIADALAGQ